jgi:5'-deoxynucleotidase YfbR-like HD superfamily hydrolase
MISLNDYLKETYGSSNRLFWFLRGGEVSRFHNEPLRKQRVAEHSWRVRIIIDYLWPDASEALRNAAIYHDVAEGLTGDIPAPIKRHPAVTVALHGFEHEFEQFLGLPDLCEVDTARLKIADYLELVLTVDEQSPHRAAHVRRNGQGYIGQALEAIGDEVERHRLGTLITQIVDEHLRLNRG